MNKSFYKLVFIFGCLFSLQSMGQIISTVCGNGYPAYYGNGVAATTAQLYTPSSVALDLSGTLYFVDQGNNMVRAISNSGTITDIAGKGGPGYSGDGGPATNALLNPQGVTVDALGNIYIADIGNNVIRKINPLGTISTIAGNDSSGYFGDGGPATMAKLNQPYGVAVDAVGNLFIADKNNNCIRKVNATGIISTIAGNVALGGGYNSDGISATLARLDQPCGVAVDASGNIFIADQGNYRIRKINSSGIISTVFSDSMMTGIFINPVSVAVDASGNIFVAETYNNNIFKINIFGIVG